jgi:hypothetical protein
MCKPRVHAACILLTLFAGVSLPAQQKASIQAREVTGRSGESAAQLSVAADGDSDGAAQDVGGDATKPCAAVTSNGTATANSVPVFTAPCAVAAGASNQTTNSLGTVLNVHDALFVASRKNDWPPTSVAGCSNPHLATIAFDNMNGCTGFSLGFGVGGVGNQATTIVNAPAGGEVDIAIGALEHSVVSFDDNGASFHSNVDASGGMEAASFTTHGSVSIGGNLNVSGHKNFRIDDPLDPAGKYLFHSSIESSEMIDIYSGNIVTDAQGEAVVQLPDWFQALNTDFRYQLTVIGDFAQAVIASEVHDNRFGIRTDKPGVKVSWQVTGVRQDPYAKANPLVVEQDKPEGERGHYLHPELYAPQARQTPPAAAVKGAATGSYR